MKNKEKGKGTAKYIAGEVTRFDQKNDMYKRTRWQPELREVSRKLFGLVYPKDKEGHTLKDMAFKNAAWHIETGFAHGTIIHDNGMYAWDMKLVGVSQVPEDLNLEIDDPAKMSQDIKKVAKFFGASRVGICELDRRWVYSHSFHFATREHKELELPEEYKYAIVMVFEMDYELAKTSPTWVAEATEGKGYSMMAVTATMVAQFIRGLGYKAIPSGNDTALNIPLAIDAGLGELGRNGLLIMPHYGPRLRMSKVLTDLPLVPDEPIEFGVIEYCEKCNKCAKYCPGQAILWGERTTQPNNISNASSELKWPIDAERCFAFWARNEGSCMNCIRVCPFNKPAGSLHNVVRWLVKHTPWLDWLLLKMDDLFGYGKQEKARKYWAD
ncbi:MAG: reductive dehalogenase [Dehalococcoidia bacterium]|nr:reductive dehalogenase [Dehalococcoidia bacterium]